MQEVKNDHLVLGQAGVYGLGFKGLGGAARGFCFGGVPFPGHKRAKIVLAGSHCNRLEQRRSKDVHTAFILN